MTIGRFCWSVFWLSVSGATIGMAIGEIENVMARWAMVSAIASWSVWFGLLFEREDVTSDASDQMLER